LKTFNTDPQILNLIKIQSILLDMKLMDRCTLCKELIKRLSKYIHNFYNLGTMS